MSCVKLQSKRLEIMAIPTPVSLLFAKFLSPSYQSTTFYVALFINTYSSSFYYSRCIRLLSMSPYHFMFYLLRTELFLYRVIQEEMSTFWKVILSVIVRKNKFT
jgi:hypothetical protein